MKESPDQALHRFKDFIEPAASQETCRLLKTMADGPPNLSEAALSRLSLDLVILANRGGFDKTLNDEAIFYYTRLLECSQRRLDIRQLRCLAIADTIFVEAFGITSMRWGLSGCRLDMPMIGYFDNDRVAVLLHELLFFIKEDAALKDDIYTIALFLQNSEHLDEHNVRLLRSEILPECFRWLRRNPAHALAPVVQQFCDDGGASIMSSSNPRGF